MINLKRHLKTPNLFDVPKDRPTRKERLDAFKEQHEIWTHHSSLMSKADEPWNAMWLQKAKECISDYEDTSKMGPMDLIAGYCSILESASILVTGETEREAIEELCRLNKIPFDL